jgi:serine-type D-Ala-D-Ala endopeptidase (penicillin-binding protein 7)
MTMRLPAIAAMACFATLISLSSHARSPMPPPAENLELASVHALVTGLDNGQLLFAKHPDREVPIASITKLMTAMVVLDGGQPLDEWIEIVARDRPSPANAYSRIRVGSEARRGDLLRISLMSSENLASHVLARHYPGGFDVFVAAMNTKARAIGMTRTRFVDATGLSSENTATAEDLVQLVRAAYGYALIREYSTHGQVDVHFRQPRYTLIYANTNPLTRAERWKIGLSKTGYLTAAGRCLVMVATIGDQPMVLVLLDSLGQRSPIGDAGRIRRWLETGASGSVAGPARDYERQRVAALRPNLAATDEPTRQDTSH